MKNYAKKQYAGNINKWDETKHETLSVHTMSEERAEELNKQFDATGVKYEETKVKPHEFVKADAKEPVSDELDGEQKPAKKVAAKKAKKEPVAEEPKA